MQKIFYLSERNKTKTKLQKKKSGSFTSYNQYFPYRFFSGI